MSTARKPLPDKLPYRLRPAAKQDAPAIRKLVWQAHINPLGLAWQRFTVAVDPGDVILACGQIKPHSDGTRELASIVVHPHYRSLGLARLLIEHLLSGENGPVYLTCRSSLRPFYEKFGFSVLSPDQMSPYFRRIWRLVHLFSTDQRMLVMRRS